MIVSYFKNNTANSKSRASRGAILCESGGIEATNLWYGCTPIMSVCSIAKRGGIAATSVR